MLMALCMTYLVLTKISSVVCVLISVDMWRLTLCCIGET